MFKKCCGIIRFVDVKALKLRGATQLGYPRPLHSLPSPKRLGGSGVVLLSAGGLFSILKDVEIGDSNREAQLDRAYADRSSLSWRERLEVMWTKDAYNNISPELSQTYEVANLGFVGGFCWGFFIESRQIFEKFVEENKHEMFRSPRDAQAALRNKMTLDSIKAGVRLGFKFCIVVSMYSACTQSCNVARNYINPLDHAAVGFILGAMYRAKAGPKAMIGSGVVGCGLAFIEGLSKLLLSWLTGMTVEERFEQQYLLQKNKTKLARQEARAQRINNPQKGDVVSRADWSPDGPEGGEVEEDTSKPNETLVWIVRKIYELFS